MPSATLVTSPKAARVPISLAQSGISPAAEEECCYFVARRGDAIQVLCEKADN